MFFKSPFSPGFTFSQTTNCRILHTEKLCRRHKLKEPADNNTKFDRNGRKFSKWVENTMEKGEIACCEQFLIFPYCFQKTYILQTSKNSGLVCERVNKIWACVALSQTSPGFYLSEVQVF